MWAPDYTKYMGSYNNNIKVNITCHFLAMLEKKKTILLEVKCQPWYFQVSSDTGQYFQTFQGDFVIFKIEGNCK